MVPFRSKEKGDQNSKIVRDRCMRMGCFVKLQSQTKLDYLVEGGKHIDRHPSLLILRDPLLQKAIFQQRTVAEIELKNLSASLHASGRLIVRHCAPRVMPGET